MEARMAKDVAEWCRKSGTPPAAKARNVSYQSSAAVVTQKQATSGSKIMGKRHVMYHHSGRSFAFGYMMASYIIAALWLRDVGANVFSVIVFSVAPISVPCAPVLLGLLSVLPDGASLIQSSSGVLRHLVALTAGCALLVWAILQCRGKGDLRRGESCPTAVAVEGRQADQSTMKPS